MKATTTRRRLHLSLALHDNALSLGEVRAAMQAIVDHADLDVTAADLSLALIESMRPYPALIVKESRESES
jgi:hypothetical protein